MLKSVKYLSIFVLIALQADVQQIQTPHKHRDEDEVEEVPGIDVDERQRMASRVQHGKVHYSEDTEQDKTHGVFFVGVVKVVDLFPVEAEQPIDRQIDRTIS